MPKKLTIEEFIKRAKEIHGNKYDYSKVEYVNSSTKLCIICPIHGEFYVRPSDHIQNKVGCASCKGVKKMSTEDFIEKARNVYGDKYDYSKVKYVNNKTKVCIICPIHGEFWQRPNDHLNGYECQKCAKNHHYTTEEWIAEARKVHNDKYDYSKVNYIDAHTKVCIICPKHGEFWQIPNNHLNGNKCPKCSRIYSKSQMSIGIKNMLIEKGFEIEEEKTFEWLKNKRNLKIDFYLPKYNIAIEVQGEQHFKSIPKFGGDNGFEKRILCDKLKKKLCEENNVKIFYITKNRYNIDEIIQYVNETSNKE